ncbi:ribosome small subunit-dependent GTPase A [Uliginosibacterium gangwonense]|uniref:ribosome small subunit-dependent GTPase A n=1 Tax=Uliginosibacterium gangwonense TaxID=392736 RepID=UPI00036E2AEE|nr:ribosome small subunit-dependent GTPase A [Uliginosibacterium gangwonense]
MKPAMIEMDYPALQAIGLTPSLINAAFSLPEATLPSVHMARIIEIARNRFTVHNGARSFPLQAQTRLMIELDSSEHTLAVGDWVLVAPKDPDEDWIVAQVPPLNHIARRTSDGQRQALVSNIDTALLVMGLDHDFNPRRLERCLSMTHAAGVEAVVVLSKMDIGIEVEARIANLHSRLPKNINVISINGLSEATCTQLEPWLTPGHTLVMLGSSGAGKSTLTNTLLGNQTQQTGLVRQNDSRGRHTTTARSLYRIPGGACIIDTPGLRTWNIDADMEDISGCFSDIETLAAQCHFRDCQHLNEPGCAVRDAIDPDRLRNYHKLLREASRTQQSVLERKAELQRWKATMKAGHARLKEKRGE